MSSFVVYLSKNGATPALAAAAAPVEVGATNAKGLFYVTLAAADIDTPGALAIRITNTGGTKTMEPREIVVALDLAYFATIFSGTSPASFTCSRTEVDTDHWAFALGTFLTGALAGQTRKVSGFTPGSPSTLKFTSPFTRGPTNGDVLELLNR